MELIFSNKSNKCGTGRDNLPLEGKMIHEKDQRREREEERKGTQWALKTNASHLIWNNRYIRNWFDFVDFDLCWSCLLSQSKSFHQLLPQESNSFVSFCYSPPVWMSDNWLRQTITHHLDVCSMDRLAINNLRVTWQCKRKRTTTIPQGHNNYLEDESIFIYYSQDTNSFTFLWPSSVIVP